MKHFVKGIVITKEEYESYDGTESLYDYFSDGDYITHILFDITDEKNPITLYCGDNTHDPIEIIIENFLCGCYYSKLEYVVTKDVLFVSNKNYCYYGDIDYKDCIIVN